MNELETDAIRARIEQWERASEVLERLRDESIRSAETPSAMRIYEGAASWAAKHRPAEPWSGLVEQQRLFQKLRRS